MASTCLQRNNYPSRRNLHSRTTKVLSKTVKRRVRQPPIHYLRSILVMTACHWPLTITNIPERYRLYLTDAAIMWEEEEEERSTKRRTRGNKTSSTSKETEKETVYFTSSKRRLGCNSTETISPIVSIYSPTRDPRHRQLCRAWISHAAHIRYPSYRTQRAAHFAARRLVGRPHKDDLGVACNIPADADNAHGSTISPLATAQLAPAPDAQDAWLSSPVKKLDSADRAPPSSKLSLLGCPPEGFPEQYREQQCLALCSKAKAG